MNPIAKRRWLKYLIGVIGVFIFVLLVWLDTRSKWISERNEMRTWVWAHAGSMEDETSVPPMPMPAPWSLRLYGETGVASITVDERKMFKQLPAEEVRDPVLAARRLQRLFPEAVVRARDDEGREIPLTGPTPASN